MKLVMRLVVHVLQDWIEALQISLHFVEVLSHPNGLRIWTEWGGLYDFLVGVLQDWIEAFRISFRFVVLALGL